MYLVEFSMCVYMISWLFMFYQKFSNNPSCGNNSFRDSWPWECLLSGVCGGQLLQFPLQHSNGANDNMWPIFCRSWCRSSSEHEKAAEQGTSAWSSSDISCGNRDFASSPWFAAVSLFPGFLMQTSSVLRHLFKHARCQWCETNITFHLISSHHFYSEGYVRSNWISLQWQHIKFRTRWGCVLEKASFL